MENQEILDLAIIGGGPAGLTAGMYATRGGLKNVVMYENSVLGGKITKSSEIENYPGVSRVISGMELMEEWPQQCSKFGLKTEYLSVTRVSKGLNNLFEVLLEDGRVVKAKTVIVCTGADSRKSGVKGEDEFYGRGVSFCATCDGFFYKDKEVAVLGGGDAALEEALFLSRICSKVYLIHRREGFRAAPIIIEKAKEEPKIEFLLNTTIEEIRGDAMGLTGLTLSKDGGEDIKLDVLGLFVFVGMDVNNVVLKQPDGSFLCAMSEKGEVMVDINMKTSIPGLFAAGDMRVNAPKQVVCAAGDGALAAINVIHYIDNLFEDLKL